MTRLPFELFLGLRYLKPKRTFLAIITLISVIGVTLGITVLILVMSVMTGFERELQRKVIGFDTFEGHASFSKKDGGSEYVTELTGKTGTYAVPGGYEDYLAAMFEAHAQDNVLPQVRKYELVKGNVVKTIGQYLRDNPETIIALAYFDLALYEPTKKCLEAVLPHLVRGSILAIDELNAHHYPGETIAVKEVLGLSKYQVLKSRFLHDRSYIIIE